MTTLEILKAARELLAVPERWTQGGGQRDHNGNLVNWDEPGITCRCVWQTLRFVSQPDMNMRIKYPAKYYSVLGFKTLSELVTWNDAPERTHAEVLARFDEAIAKLEEKVC